MSSVEGESLDSHGAHLIQWTYVHYYFFPFFPRTQSENSSFFIFFSLHAIDERDRRDCFGAEKQIYRMCIMTNITPSVLHIKQNTTVGATKAIRSLRSWAYDGVQVTCDALHFGLHGN